MKLLYDLKAAQPNESGKVHGGGKYALAVFFELVRQGVPMDCVYDSNLYLREDVMAAITEKGIKLHDLRDKTLHAIVKDNGIDTYYSAYTDFKGSTIPGIRNICTIHGLRELEMPRDWWMLKYKTTPYLHIKRIITLLLYHPWKKVLLRRYKKRLTQPGLDYVTVSNHTREACHHYIPQLKNKDLQVCYSPSTVDDSIATKPFSLGTPYLLLVSGNRTEKNVLRALTAIDQLISTNALADFKVIITGAALDTYRHTFAYGGRFVFFDYVDETTLASLYAGAYAFIYPSINEGFGYPPLEAMRHGTPVVASSATSIPEVCGEAAIYFNPFDISDIKDKIRQVITDPTLCDILGKKSKERYAAVTKRQNEDLKRLVSFIQSEPIIFYGPTGQSLKDMQIGGAELGCQKTLSLYKSQGFNPVCIEKAAFSGNWLEYAINTYRQTKALLQECKMRPCTPVHFVGFYNNIIKIEHYLVKQIKKIGNPIIYEMRNGNLADAYYGKDDNYRRLQREIWQAADCLLCQGKLYLDLIKAETGCKSTFYPNFVKKTGKRSNENSPDANNLNLAFQGRLVKNKNIELMIDATSLLQNKYPGARLHLIGACDEKYKKALDRRISQLPLSPESVIFHGFQSSDYITSILAQSHFFIFPSANPTEGHSNALTEAMSYGVVPIASHAGFNRYVCGDDSLIIDSMSAQAYADKIAEIIDTGMWQGTSKAMQRRVADLFTEEAVSSEIIPTILKLYQEKGS